MAASTITHTSWANFSPARWFGFNKEKAQRVRRWAFGYRFSLIGFIFIVATALTPDELQRLHYHGELA